MTELTVVMTVYNGGPHLAPALESIMTQSIRDFEVLVVNDGSTDQSATILDEYARRDARIRVIHQRNTGVVGALNTACAIVETPYIARLDADDISLSDRLERQTEFLRRNPHVALFGGAADFINEAGEVLFRVDVPTNNNDIKTQLLERNVFVHSAVVVRREALLAVGGYRRPFPSAEDYDLWLRISERYAVANLSEVVVRYRLHPKQASTARLEGQVLATMGARLSARLRRAGKPDPSWSTGPVSRQDLSRLGVSSDEIDVEIAKGAATWASVMQRAGYHETAANLAKQAWRHGRGSILTRETVGWFYLASARSSVLQGQDFRGLVSAIRALRWQPALLWRVLRGGFRRLTGS
jgi:hypothetical protein